MSTPAACCRRGGLAFALLLGACPAPNIALTISGAPEGASLFVRVFTPLEMPSCDDVAFGDLPIDNLAAVKRLEAPLDQITTLKLPFGQNALILVEGLSTDGALTVAGCTTTVVPRSDLALTVALENVSEATTAEPVTLLKTDALSALLLSDGSDTPLRINLNARARVRVLDRAGAELKREIVQAEVLETLPLPDALLGPFAVEILPAWSNTALRLDGVAARIERLDITARGEVFLVGERQGHAPTVVSIDGNVVKREIVDGDTATVNVPPNSNAFFVGALPNAFVFFLEPALLAGEYRLLDANLEPLSALAAQPPLKNYPALSYEGCAAATQSLLVSHRGTGDLATMLTRNGNTLSAVVVDATGFQFQQAVNMVCFGGGCLDVDDRSLSAAACGLFVSNVLVGQGNVIGDMNAPTLFVPEQATIAGIVPTDGTPRETVDGEERVLISARHNEVVELSSYAIDDRDAQFRHLEAVLPVEPTVMRRTADGLVVGIVVGDTARIVIMGPSREPDGLRALGSITLPCEGCADSAAASASCALREGECPPALLIETGAPGDVIVVGGFEDGARVFTAIDTGS